MVDKKTIEKDNDSTSPVEEKDELQMKELNLRLRHIEDMIESLTSEI